MREETRSDYAPCFAAAKRGQRQNLGESACRSRVFRTFGSTGRASKYLMHYAWNPASASATEASALSAALRSYRSPSTSESGRLRARGRNGGREGPDFDRVQPNRRAEHRHERGGGDARPCSRRRRPHRSGRQPGRGEELGGAGSQAGQAKRPPPGAENAGATAGEERKATPLPSPRNLSTPIQWRAGGTAPGRCSHCGRHRGRRGTGIRSPSP